MNHDRLIAVIHDLIKPQPGPGLQYAAVDTRGIRFAYAAGCCNVTGNRPLELTHTLMLHSITKVLTAIAVLQCIEARQCALDDPLDFYVSDLPYGSAVTLRRLLAQTSGLPHPMPLKWIHLPVEAARYDREHALRAVIAQHPATAFAPGERCAYSNLSYWLLGSVIERVSGRPYGDYVRTRIAEPLGITPAELSTCIPDPARQARGYLPLDSPFIARKDELLDTRLLGNTEASWVRIHDYYPNDTSSCGLFGTAAAVGKVLSDLLCPQPRLLSAKSKALLFEPQRANCGDAVPMSLGWHMAEADGRPYYFKEGCGIGFHGEARVYLDQARASVVVANNMAFDVKNFLQQVDV